MIPCRFAGGASSSWNPQPELTSSASGSAAAKISRAGRRDEARRGVANVQVILATSIQCLSAWGALVPGRERREPVPQLQYRHQQILPIAAVDDSAVSRRSRPLQSPRLTESLRLAQSTLADSPLQLPQPVSRVLSGHDQSRAHRPLTASRNLVRAWCVTRLDAPCGHPETLSPKLAASSRIRSSGRAETVATGKRPAGISCPVRSGFSPVFPGHFADTSQAAGNGPGSRVSGSST